MGNQTPTPNSFIGPLGPPQQNQGFWDFSGPTQQELRLGPQPIAPIKENYIPELYQDAQKSYLKDKIVYDEATDWYPKSKYPGMNVLTSQLDNYFRSDPYLKKIASNFNAGKNAFGETRIGSGVNSIASTLIGRPIQTMVDFGQSALGLLQDIGQSGQSLQKFSKGQFVDAGKLALQSATLMPRLGQLFTGGLAVGGSVIPPLLTAYAGSYLYEKMKNSGLSTKLSKYREANQKNEVIAGKIERAENRKINQQKRQYEKKKQLLQQKILSGKADRYQLEDLRADHGYKIDEMQRETTQKVKTAQIESAQLTQILANEFKKKVLNSKKMNKMQQVSQEQQQSQQSQQQPQPKRGKGKKMAKQQKKMAKSSGIGKILKNTISQVTSSLTQRLAGQLGNRLVSEGGRFGDKMSQKIWNYHPMKNLQRKQPNGDIDAYIKQKNADRDFILNVQKRKNPNQAQFNRIKRKPLIRS